MFTKVNLILRTKNIGYIIGTNKCLQCGIHSILICKSPVLYGENNLNTICHVVDADQVNYVKHRSIFLSTPLARTFCANTEPKKADVFGDLSYRQSYEVVEMDEQEKEEEKFTEHEAQLPRKKRLSPGRYAALIKSHLGKKDLTSALGVLDLAKQNRDKPTVYMYNLLIRAFALQGDLKQSFKLYNNMKKRALKPNNATFTSLFNACANSQDTTKAMEQLLKVRHYAVVHGPPLNHTNYNAMIKAYGLHNHIQEAFLVADEMRDKRIKVGSVTYASLLMAAISDKEAGLRHALVIWHLMRLKKIPLDINTYNLLLKAMKECKLGNLKINDAIIPGKAFTKICLSETTKPNLLALPATISTLLLPLPTDKGTETEANNSEIDVPNTTDLNNIFLKNRLILFGGYEGIIERMNEDNVTPTAKTITLLMELVPDSTSAENKLIQYAKSINVKLDVQFFNALIKKRNLRYDFAAANEVLNEMQLNDLRPNIATFGVLALGCRDYDEGFQLLKGMESTGYMPNCIILGALIKNACVYRKFKYLHALMDYMCKWRIKPSPLTFQHLDKLVTDLTEAIKQKTESNREKRRKHKKDLKLFKETYKKWQENIQKL